MSRASTGDGLSVASNDPLSSLSPVGASSVQVVVRLRPFNEREKKHGTLPVVTASTNDKSVTVIKGQGSRQVKTRYSKFDNVFTAFSTQEEVFDQTLKPVIADVLKGFESTVFAYGQTGTGKTFTLEGDINDPQQQGVIPRAAQAIFDKLRHPQYTDKNVTVSYLEIYNEELCDLLADPQDTTTHAAAMAHKRSMPKLDIMEGKSGTFCRGLSQSQVNSAEDVLMLMRKAQQQRHVGETKMNKESSRSHCIFTIYVHANLALKDGTMEFNGKLHMVDLAGSECAKTANMDKPTAADAARERERMNINRSLLTLGRVISMLKEMNDSKRSSSVRIPYRDSKLTRILQESLGGRCKTVIIATLSPSITAIEESMSTLNYAQAAVGIINKPISTSFMSLTPGKAPPALRNSAEDADKSHENQVEYWHEMECRLQYMQAQVEEAQAALARKHLQQQELQERNEKLEAEAFEWETKHRKAEERIQSLEESLDQETKKRQATELALQSTEEELERKKIILRATQETELRLTQEASRLLYTLELSVAEGHKLQTLLKEKAEIEADKISATKVLHTETDQMLTENSKALQAILSTVVGHCKGISLAANELNTEASVSIDNAIVLIKNLAEAAEIDFSSLKDSVMGSEGLMTKIHDAKTDLSNNLSAINAAFSEGEQTLRSQCQEAHRQLQEQSKKLQSFREANSSLFDHGRSNLTSSIGRINEVLQNIEQAAIGAITHSKTVRENAKSQHMKELQKWMTTSSAASQNLSTLALGQSEELGTALKVFQEDTKVHDKLSISLAAQEEIISTGADEHRTIVSSQKEMMTVHQKSLADTQKRHQELQAACLKTMLEEMKTLMESQMTKLMSQSASDMSNLIENSLKLQQLNQQVDASGNSVIHNLTQTTEQLRQSTTASKETSSTMFKAIENSKQQFASITSLSRKHADDCIKSFEKASITFKELSESDESNAASLTEISSHAKAGMERETVLLSTSTKETLDSIQRSTQHVETYSLDKVIPSSRGALNSILEPREVTKQKMDKGQSSVVATMAKQERQMNAFSTALTKTLGSSRDMIASKRAQHDAILGKQLKDLIKNNNQRVIGTTQLISNEEKTSCDANISRTEQIRTKIVGFAENEMKVNEKPKEVPEKQEYKYSKIFSSTPSEADLFRAITPRSASSAAQGASGAYESSMSTIDSPGQMNDAHDKENNTSTVSTGNDENGDAASVKSNESLNNSSLSNRSTGSILLTSSSPPRSVLQSRQHNRVVLHEGSNSLRKPTPGMARSTSKGYPSSSHPHLSRASTTGAHLTNSARANRKNKRSISSNITQSSHGNGTLSRPESSASSVTGSTPTKSKRIRKTGTPSRARFGRPM